MAIEIRIHEDRAHEVAGEIITRTGYQGETIMVQRSCAGRVVGLGEHNYHDDSDFYALVWDDAQGRPVEIQYASTRGPTYDNSADVDATPEVAAKYAAYLEAARLRALIARLETQWSRCDVRGLDVVVVAGRKVAKGTVGRVFWVGEASRYAHNSPIRTRIGLDLTGLKDEQGRAKDVAWTYAENCRRVALDPANAAELERLRAKMAAAQDLYAPTVAAAVAA